MFAAGTAKRGYGQSGLDLFLFAVRAGKQDLIPADGFSYRLVVRGKGPFSG